MSTAIKNDNTIVVVQLTGGNDFMDTIIPYTNGIYYDSRPTLSINQDDVLPIDETLGFHPAARSLKNLFDDGKVAVIQGVGYENSSRSHFRAMDIMHTCEPEKVGTQGWLGRTIQEIDPHQENVLTGVNIGRGLPRSMALSGVPVTSIGDLDNYGLMTSVDNMKWRTAILDNFKDIYTQAIGTGPVSDFLGRTGNDILRSADLLKDVPSNYESTVEYAENPIAKSLRDVARIHTADMGTKVFYVQHGGYDTHADQGPNHPRLLTELTDALSDFMDDLREHNASENISILVFTEFGRRMRDNGSGTDHGAGGGAFLIGDTVKGGLYGDYPSLEPSEWQDGENLKFNVDFRSVYATALEQWLRVDSRPMVFGSYEQLKVY
ncbi:DUF1501 domain-containing protein [Dehalococcoidia bacterium]|nr:DUF1501 domain-containing protein [Dehalococcoidia bacterium]